MRAPEDRRERWKEVRRNWRYMKHLVLDIMEIQRKKYEKEYGHHRQ